MNPKSLQQRSPNYVELTVEVRGVQTCEGLFYASLYDREPQAALTARHDDAEPQTARQDIRAGPRPGLDRQGHEAEPLLALCCVHSHPPSSGTGFVQVVFNEENQDTYFVVKSEANENDVVLQSRIYTEDVYQLQQGEGVVWFFFLLRVARAFRVLVHWSAGTGRREHASQCWGMGEAADVRVEPGLLR
jgi:hypothetical protein